MRAVPARNAVSIASANCRNVCDRAAANTRPGRGHSVRPPPWMSSTRIDSQLRHVWTRDRHIVRNDRQP
ncbi:MAG: hypothetical protein LC777_17695, partial [Actinobacteria bacterium]|nr:hypothetical protein [Actinomycetota bacterium]